MTVRLILVSSPSAFMSSFKMKIELKVNFTIVSHIFSFAVCFSHSFDDNKQKIDEKFAVDD